MNQQLSFSLNLKISVLLLPSPGMDGMDVILQAPDASIVI